MPKGDDTKCTRCGEPFVSSSGPYIRHGFVGMYHKRCLPRGPAPDPYRAGLIAGLREAAEWHDQKAAASRITVEHASRAELRKYAKASVYTHERSAEEIRARIAALETEETK